MGAAGKDSGCNSVRMTCVRYGGGDLRGIHLKMNMRSMRKKSKKKGDRCSGLPFSSLCQTLKTLKIL